MEGYLIGEVSRSKTYMIITGSVSKSTSCVDRLFSVDVQVGDTGEIMFRTGDSSSYKSIEEMQLAVLLMTRTFSILEQIKENKPLELEPFTLGMTV
jgi:uncharacterized protein (DUF2126 family)